MDNTQKQTEQTEQTPNFWPHKTLLYDRVVEEIKQRFEKLQKNQLDIIWEDSESWFTEKVYEKTIDEFLNQRNEQRKSLEYNNIEYFDHYDWEC